MKMNKKRKRQIQEGIEKAEEEEKIVTDEIARDYKDGTKAP